MKWILSFLLLFVACTPSKPLDPPIAKKIPHKHTEHGDLREDPYYWMKERKNPEVVAHLEKENEYIKKSMSHTEGLQKKLFEEMKGRIKKNDDTVPSFKNGYYFYSRVEEGKEYSIHCRKKGNLEAKEEIILDVNKLAKGHKFFGVRGVKSSPNNKILAYAVDTVGRRNYDIKFIDLATGKHLKQEIKQVTSNFVWASDNNTLFITGKDPKTLRSDKIYRYNLNKNDRKQIYFEKDDTFGAYVYKSSTDEYIFLGSYHTLTSEVRYLKADNPLGKFRLFQKRERKHEYSVDHGGDYFFIRTNWNAKNFKIMKTPISKTSKENWKEVIAHNKNILIKYFEVFKNYLVVASKENGLDQMGIYKRKSWDKVQLKFDDPTYSTYSYSNPNFDTEWFRYGYESLTTPSTVYDYNMKTGERVLKKQDEILGGFDSKKYKSERLFAKASDGRMIPISLVYKEGVNKDGSAPLLLYGYGSYGYSMGAYFSSKRLTLLDRGFIYAIAHIRGGSDMGRFWYEEGKLLKKMNTFTDFNTCAKFLIEKKYTSSKNLYAQGGSAGGLLMGAVMNLEPNLYNGVLAHVPFVDVVTTMLDESLPLTTGEYDEWGDPRKKEYYEYIKSYSPYDNVKAQNYPNILVTTGFHDSQVQYWEPAKWVARLRELKTDSNKLYFRTYMDTGHSGTTGRFKRLKEAALNYAFLLDLAGKD